MVISNGASTPLTGGHEIEPNKEPLVHFYSPLSTSFVLMMKWTILLCFLKYNSLFYVFIDSQPIKVDYKIDYEMWTIGSLHS